MGLSRYWWDWLRYPGDDVYGEECVVAARENFMMWGRGKMRFILGKLHIVPRMLELKLHSLLRVVQYCTFHWWSDIVTVTKPIDLRFCYIGLLETFVLPFLTWFFVFFVWVFFYIVAWDWIHHHENPPFGRICLALRIIGPCYRRTWTCITQGSGISSSHQWLEIWFSGGSRLFRSHLKQTQAI